MEDKKKAGVIANETTGDTDTVEWGETNRERIVDDSEKSRSQRHHCKGPACSSAFDKL